METMHLTCKSCSGMGYTIDYDVIDRSDDTVTVKSKELACERCAGKGYREYVLFDIEEAKTILKHCGLSTES